MEIVVAEEENTAALGLGSIPQKSMGNPNFKIGLTTDLHDELGLGSFGLDSVVVKLGWVALFWACNY